MAGGAENIPLRLTAELGDLNDKLKQIPGITAKEAKLMVAQLDKNFRDAARAAREGGKKAAKGWDALREGADAAGEKAAKLRGVLDTLSPSAGAAAGLVNDLGDAVMVLASPAGLAAAAVAGIGLSAVAAGAALVKAVFASDEALASLEGFRKIGSDFYPEVPADTLASITAVNAASDALGSIWGSLVVTVGANVAPALEKITDIAVGLALKARDMFADFADGRSLLEDFAQFLVARMVDGLLSPLKPLQWLARSIQLAAQAAGVELPASVNDAFDELRGLNEEVTRGATAMIGEAYAGSVLARTFDEAGARGHRFVTEQERATKAMTAGKAAAAEMAAAYKTAIRAMDEDAAAVQSVDRGIQQLADAERTATTASLDAIGQRAAVRDQDLLALEQTYQETLRLASTNSEAQLAVYTAYEAARVAVTTQAEAEIVALSQAAQDQVEAGLQARLDAARATVGQTLSTLAGAAEGALTAVASALDGTYTTAAIVAFRISQAVAIAQATMSAYRAAVEAAAAVAGIPGVGPAAAVAAGVGTFAALEAAFISKIAAQAPPSFAAGGVISGGMGGGVDHVAVTRRELETGVLSPRGVDAAGGPRGVQRLNRGDAPTEVQAIVSLGGRLEDRNTRRRVRGPGALSAALTGGSAGKRRGHGRQ